ncbi:Ribosomal protein S12 methylthiotransferase accessory factor YcaO [bioreactor metagenome]|uniref:Ribosomal protein S12 methylthiotransferase accessory factor YcaO n=1 Tax=bioreactor metagenome TaxID=1076179 RepID=A0A644TMF0_9ZZZZ
MDIAKMNYKDAVPINTINKIRTILGESGLLTLEHNWKNSVAGFHSVSVIIEGTELMTNGKGASTQFALASAYGELMERLQNFCTFRLSMDFSPETLNYQGFYYAPDEVVLSFDNILNSKEDWLTWQLSHLKPESNVTELLKMWQKVSYEDISGDFIALPFFNLRNSKLSHIPMKMVSKMYMSNGMCAGNTAEEALVQGISELLERYVNKKVIREKVVPPTIPREYLRQIHRLDAMISGIEMSGSFEVIIKDCSLGEGLPVVGVILINKSDQSYFVKFGAHPVFEIAAERTLTELLQGQDIHRMMGVREFSYRNEEYNDPNNMMSILVNGSGVYPTEFFSQNFSYEFQGFPKSVSSSNKSMLAKMVEALFAKSYDVYIRDVSYLDFPAFHVIIPGLSEIETFDDINSIIEYADFNKVRKYLRNMENFNKEKATEVINFLKTIKYSPDASVPELMNLPVKDGDFPWYYSNLDLFVTALYLWQKDYANAYRVFTDYLAEREANAHRTGAITYYKCLRDYIGAKMDKVSEKEITEILEIFYPADIVQGVLNEFSDVKDLLTYKGYFSCWNCRSCPFRRQCLHPSTERVYRILKKRYAENPPSQEALFRLLPLE